MSRYFVDGYLDANYFDETVVDTGTYYVDGYLESGYFVNDAVGGVQEASATLISAFGVGTVPGIVYSATANLSFEFVHGATSEYLFGTSVQLQGTTTLDGTVERIQASTSSLTASFGITATVTRIISAEANLSSATNPFVLADANVIASGGATFAGVFAPNIVIHATRGGDVDLIVVTNLNSTASKLNGATVTLDNIVNLSLQAARIRDNSMAIAASFAATPIVSRTRATSSSLAISFDLNATAQIIKSTSASFAVVSQIGTLELDGSIGIGTNSGVIVNPGAALTVNASLVGSPGEVHSAQAQLSVDSEMGTITGGGGIGIGTNAVVIVNPGSSFDASTSLTATANTIADRSATLSSTSTVVCEAIRIPFGMDLDSEFTLTAIPDYRPVNIQTSGSITFDINTKKWGPASINVGTSSSDKFYVEGLNDAFRTQLYQAWNDGVVRSNDGYYTSFEIGFWLYIPTGLTSSVKNLVTITNQYGVDDSLDINEDYLTTTNNGDWDATVSEPAGNTWHHIRWKRLLQLGSYIGFSGDPAQSFEFYDTIYVNGVQHHSDVVGAYKGTISTISFGNGSGYKFDDVHAYKYEGTDNSYFSGYVPAYPSEAYRNATLFEYPGFSDTNTAFLIHGDGSLVDDLGETQPAGVNMFSVAELSASATRIKGLVATLTSQFGIGILNTTLLEATATLASTSTIACEPTVLELVDIQPATFHSEFVQTVDADKIVNVESDITCTSTISCDINVEYSLAGELVSEFTLTTIPDETLATATITCTTSIQATATASYQASATLESEFAAELVFYNRDRYVYVVPRETRVFTVDKETRTHTIHKENRKFTLGAL